MFCVCYVFVAFCLFLFLFFNYLLFIFGIVKLCFIFVLFLLVLGKGLERQNLYIMYSVTTTLMSIVHRRDLMTNRWQFNVHTHQRLTRVHSVVKPDMLHHPRPEQRNIPITETKSFAQPRCQEQPKCSSN